jgi:hypothetical protein
MGLSDLTIFVVHYGYTDKALLIFQEGFLVHDILNTLLVLRDTIFTFSWGK